MQQRCLTRSSSLVSRHGQSLIEAIIAIGVVALLVTGLIVATTVSLKVSRLGRMRSTANKYAQEGIEVTRDLRDAGWSDFQTHSLNGGLYCLDQNNNFSFSAVPCSVNLEGIYTRSVHFAWNPPRMTVTVTVGWTDGVTPYQNQLTTFFTQWK